MEVVAEISMLENLHHKTVRKLLILGFSLVILFLLIGSMVAFHSANEIQLDSKDLLSTLQEMALKNSEAEEAIRLEVDIEERTQEIQYATALSGVCLILAIACAMITVRLIGRSIQKIEEQSNELAHVSWQMLQGQEASARRFSHELHDELGQGLAVLKANLRSINPANLEAKRADCVEIVDQAISNVREISQLLRPVILDDFGLDASLRWLCERFGERTGMKVSFRSNFEGRLRDETETHLFRIAQEALTNIARHSEAKDVIVQLLQEKDRIVLSVEDDGKGFRQGKRAGTGLIGMKARAQQIGGELLIERVRPQGFAIQVSAPAIQAESDDAEKDKNSPG